MSTTPKIAPSILSADLAYMARDLDKISNADFVHVDIMDAHFTGNLTFGPNMVKAVKRVSDVPVDCHLMIDNPDSTLQWYIDAGADMITVHVESTIHLDRMINQIKEAGLQAGVVLNPATPINALEDIIEDVDMVLLMSVNPGFGGQKFIEKTYRKIEQLKALCLARGVDPLIEIDGGVCRANIEKLAALGANVFVAGSAVYGADDPSAEIDILRDLAIQASSK